MKFLRSLLIAALTLVLLAQPVSANHLGSEDNPQFGGYFYNSAISDGVLTICFQWGTPVYYNRSSLAAGYRLWEKALNIDIVSTGSCDGPNDPSNIRIWEADHGGLAATEIMFGGYSQIEIWFNPNQPMNWTTNGNFGPVVYPVAMNVATHEVGHALGLAHEGNLVNGPNGHGDVMDGWPYSAYCVYAFIRNLSEYDARALRARYPGLTSTGTSFPSQAPCQFP